MVGELVKHCKAGRIVDEHASVFARSDQFGAIVRKLAVPDFVRMLGQVDAYV